MKKSVKKVNRIDRAQVSVFVIIAVILVAIGGVALFVSQSANKIDDSKFFTQAGSNSELTTVRGAILGCRDTSVYDSLNTIGLRGGFFSKPELAFDLGTGFVPYYFYEGKYFLPDVNFVQGELSKQINKNFKECIENLSFSNAKISHLDSKIETKIKTGEVYVKIDMPLSIQSESTYSLEMKDAPIAVNSSLYDIIDVAQFITLSHKNDSKYMCITCVADLADQKDVYVDTLQVDNSSVLVMISENHTRAEPYFYIFLNKYAEDNSEIISPPGVPSPAG